MTIGHIHYDQRHFKKIKMTWSCSITDVDDASLDLTFIYIFLGPERVDDDPVLLKKRLIKIKFYIIIYNAKIILIVKFIRFLNFTYYYNFNIVLIKFLQNKRKTEIIKIHLTYCTILFQ